MESSDRSIPSQEEIEEQFSRWATIAYPDGIARPACRLGDDDTPTTCFGLDAEETPRGAELRDGVFVWFLPSGASSSVAARIPIQVRREMHACLNQVWPLDGSATLAAAQIGDVDALEAADDVCEFAFQLIVAGGSSTAGEEFLTWIVAEDCLTSVSNRLSDLARTTRVGSADLPTYTAAMTRRAPILVEFLAGRIDGCRPL